MDVISKDTIGSKKQSIKAADRYDDLFNLRERPISEEIARRIAHELIEWVVEDNKAIKLIDFMIGKKINPGTFHKWTKRFDVLNEARKTALLIIGSRREKGAIYNKMNSTMILKRMAHYDPSWKDDEKWRAELKVKTQEESKPSTINLVYDKEYKPTEEKKDNSPKLQVSDKKKDYLPEET